MVGADICGFNSDTTV